MNQTSAPDHFDCVRDAIADMTEDVANLRLRSELMDNITTVLIDSKRRTQPRMNELSRDAWCGSRRLRCSCCEQERETVLPRNNIGRRHHPRSCLICYTRLH